MSAEAARDGRRRPGRPLVSNGRCEPAERRQALLGVGAGSLHIAGREGRDVSERDDPPGAAPCPVGDLRVNTQTRDGSRSWAPAPRRGRPQ